jgi:beta-RFAP synthase
MIQEPSTRLRVEAAKTWSAEGPAAERALGFAKQFLATFPPEIVGHPPRPHRIVIEQAAPEHMGLGTGTQLGLAVAQALALANDLGPLDVADMARRVGRGRRSAVGIHGFKHGGFLVEAGKRHPDEVAPLVARLAFPEDWRIVLILPPWGKGLHGATESQAFRNLTSPQDLATTDALCRVVLLGMLPALAEQDLPAFGEALYDFNRRVGEAFRRVQGGIYSHAETADVVAFVRQQGIRGVGQSSWGPAIFAVVQDADKGENLRRQLMERFAFAGEVVVTAASNVGAG